MRDRTGIEKQRKEGKAWTKTLKDGWATRRAAISKR